MRKCFRISEAAVVSCTVLEYGSHPFKHKIDLPKCSFSDFGVVAANINVSQYYKVPGRIEQILFYL